MIYLTRAGEEPGQLQRDVTKMADDDLGFVCKACHSFYTDVQVKEWDTKWAIRNGEKWLSEIIQRRPLCGETRSYAPNEPVFRFQARSGE